MMPPRMPHRRPRWLLVISSALTAGCGDNVAGVHTDAGRADTSLIASEASIVDVSHASDGPLRGDRPLPSDHSPVVDQTRVDRGVLLPQCGNGKLEPDELCDTGIPSGQPGACPLVCTDSSSCTQDTLLEPGTCRAVCEHAPITACLSGDSCCPPGCSSVTDCDCPSQRRAIPVLVLRYFPTKNGVDLDTDETGIWFTSLASIRSKVKTLTAQLEQALEEGSTYHGYKNASATPSLDYVIVEEREYLEKIPASTCRVDWGGTNYYGDFTKILQRENICSLVASKQIKEVWLWGYHHGNIAPAESKMGGPNGDISNSYHTCPGGGTPVVLPVCNTTYVLYNYNYDRGVGAAQENHAHQLEFALSHVDKDGLFGPTSCANAAPQSWVCPYSKKGGARNGCGNVHIPPNGQTDYDWYSLGTAQTDCEDWNPQRTGPLQEVSCTTWSSLTTCLLHTEDGLGYKRWWMQNLPGLGHMLSYQGRPLRNWWDVIADFDGTVTSGSGLRCP